MTTGSEKPAFHHGDDGTRESDWRALLPRIAARGIEVSTFARLVVVSAHPDDEALMCGGLIAAASARGLAVDVLIASDGEMSHPRSPTHRPERVAGMRRAEAERAIRILAPAAHIRFLGLGDGRLEDRRRELTHEAVDAIGVSGADSLLVSTWRGDGHPDHRAVAEAASVAAWRTDATHLEAPIWLWHWGSTSDLAALERSGELRSVELDASELGAKRAAIAEYASQLEPLGPEPGNERLLGKRVLAHFDRGIELFRHGPAVETSPFDELHRGSADPWATRTSWYERRKRALTLDALPARRYTTALEIGCSVGAMAEDLLTRCDRVVAVDESAEALAHARRAVTDPRVEFRRCRVPEQWPCDRGEPELVVISEIGYFLSPGRLAGLAKRVDASGATTVVACHWRHPIDGWPLGAGEVHAIVDEALGLPVVLTLSDADFELVVWSAAEPERSAPC